MDNKQKFLISLLNRVDHVGSMASIEQMWREGLLDKKALEKVYIKDEVERRVKAGEIKTKAIEQLSSELRCSYEKVRAIVYCKR